MDNGWEMLCAGTFEATWSGGPGRSAVAVRRIGSSSAPIAISQFGGGVLTYQSDYLFRTEQPYQLFVTGSLNNPKDGLAPLAAIVDSTWVPYTFAMNWIFTRRDTPVRFEEGEPFCQFFPISANAIEDMVPEIHDLGSNPSLWKQYHEWHLSRLISRGKLVFWVDGVKHGGKLFYQHHYQRAIMPNGDRIADRPRVRYSIREFIDVSSDDPMRLQDNPQSAKTREDGEIQR